MKGHYLRKARKIGKKLNWSTHRRLRNTVTRLITGATVVARNLGFDLGLCFFTWITCGSTSLGHRID